MRGVKTNWPESNYTWRGGGDFRITSLSPSYTPNTHTHMRRPRLLRFRCFVSITDGGDGHGRPPESVFDAPVVDGGELGPVVIALGFLCVVGCVSCGCGWVGGRGSSVSESIL